MAKDPSTDVRRTELKKVMADLNKSSGRNIVKFSNEKDEKKVIEFGIKEFDEFTGGGLVKGNFTVIYGGPAVGKSTLALTLIANAQKQNLVCVYIDLEHGFDVDWARQFGVNMEQLVLVDSVDTAEEAMDIVMTLSQQKVVDLVIVDSIQAMSPKGEQETKEGKTKSLEKDTMALLARKLGEFLRRCSPKIYRAKVAILLIGQLRTKGIGSFVTTQGLSGGNAIHHWPRMILCMRKGVKDDAPTKTVKVKGKGRAKDKKVIEQIGFDSVTKMEKTQVFGSEPEGKVIHRPFYFKTGFGEKPKA